MRIAISGVCFGGCLVFLVLIKQDWPVVLLTVASGLMLGAGLAGALIASRRMRRWESSESAGRDK